jgi:hypothetical protein
MQSNAILKMHKHGCLGRGREIGKWDMMIFRLSSAANISFFFVYFHVFFFQIESRSNLLRQLKDVRELMGSGVLDQGEYNEQRDVILKDLKAL